MGRISVKSFAQPDEDRRFADEKGHLEVIHFGDSIVGRGVFEPGWQWSKHVKPIAGTASCEASHCGYVVSGRMHLVSDEGDAADVGPGDFVTIAPGHDAWVIGDEPCIMFDFAGYADYARPRAGEPRQPEEPLQPGI